MPDWPIENGTVVTLPRLTEVEAERDELREALSAEQQTRALVTEAYADLEAAAMMARDEDGWSKVGAEPDEFTPRGRSAIRDLCRQYAISNPLIKHAINARIAYIWGGGVEIRGTVDTAADEAESVDADPVADLVAAFLESNEASLAGSTAREELERALGTDGEVFLACFTDKQSGRVQVRSTPTSEVVDVVTNPDDRDEPWFYIREYTQRVLEQGTDPGTTRTRGQKVRVAHPALGYAPATRIKTLDRAEVWWHAPVLHVPVNRLDGWLRGMPDVYASVAWARMYRDFLVDWAGLTKALSKIAYRATGDTRSKATRMAAQMGAAQAPRVGADGLPTGAAGLTAGMGPGMGLEAVSKSGATIDSQSGRPLAAMVAAGVDLPVTMLLADPGVTGARAVAETLDLPTMLAMGLRRMLWTSVFERLIRYVVGAAIDAPGGSLSGQARIDAWGRRQVTLRGGAVPRVEVDWPPISDTDPVQIISSIVAANGTGLMPPLVALRLLLTALGVKDVDQLLEQVTDEQGRFVDPRASAGQAAADAFRRGEQDQPGTGGRAAAEALS